MRHIDSEREWHFELHIPKLGRPEYCMYGKCARFIGELFEIYVFYLDVKRNVLHFKRAGYFGVGYKIMDYAIGRKQYIPLCIRFFKTEAPMLHALVLYHFVVHPSLDDLRLRIGPEEQLYR